MHIIEQPKHQFSFLLLVLIFCGVIPAFLYFADVATLSNFATVADGPNSRRFRNPQPMLRDSFGYNINSNNRGINISISHSISTTQFQMPGHRREKQRLPNVILIGAKKCGTGAISHMLPMHPDIRWRKGEVHFFNKDYNYKKGLEWYRKQMPLSFDNQITIDKSPSYFVIVKTPERVHAWRSSVPLLLVVRDPTTRAVSDYAFMLKNNNSLLQGKNTFDEFVLQRNGEVKGSSPVIRKSRYVDHFQRWLKYFPRSQIHVIDGAKLIKENPYLELRKIEKFLNLPPKLSSVNFYFNTTKGFYCMQDGTGHKSCMQDAKGQPHPEVSQSTLGKLREYFAPFNERFYRIVGQNFSWPTS